jgi:CPA2 family monovalent cation:H+ antiporter-2
MSQETYALILAGALLSISLNPFVFKLIDRMGAAPDPRRIAKAEAAGPVDSTATPDSTPSRAQIDQT